MSNLIYNVLTVSLKNQTDGNSEFKPVKKLLEAIMKGKQRIETIQDVGFSGWLAIPVGLGLYFISEEKAPFMWIDELNKTFPKLSFVLEWTKVENMNKYPQPAK